MIKYLDLKKQNKDKMAELGTQVFSIIHKYILECNCIKFSILPVILIVSAAAGLKFWLKMEMILSVLFGIALTFEPSAKFLLGLQVFVGSEVYYRGLIIYTIII